MLWRRLGKGRWSDVLPPPSNSVLLPSQHPSIFKNYAQLMFIHSHRASTIAVLLKRNTSFNEAESTGTHLEQSRVDIWERTRFRSLYSEHLCHLMDR